MASASMIIKPKNCAPVWTLVVLSMFLLPLFTVTTPAAAAVNMVGILPNLNYSVSYSASPPNVVVTITEEGFKNGYSQEAIKDCEYGVRSRQRTQTTVGS